MAWEDVPADDGWEDVPEADLSPPPIRAKSGTVGTNGTNGTDDAKRAQIDPVSDPFPIGNLERPGTALLPPALQAQEDARDTSPAGISELEKALELAKRPQNLQKYPNAPAVLEEHLGQIMQELHNRPFDEQYNTKLTPQEEASFADWKAKYAPNDSGQDYDLRGAFKAGIVPNPETGHLADTFKKPNHPSFSDQSNYAQYGPHGHWEGETFIPPGGEEPLRTTAPEVEVRGLDTGQEIINAPDQIASGELTPTEVQNGPSLSRDDAAAMRGSVMGGEIAPGPSNAPWMTEQINSAFSGKQPGPAQTVIGPDQPHTAMKLGDQRVFDSHLGGPLGDALNTGLAAVQQGLQNVPQDLKRTGAGWVRFMNDSLANPDRARFGVDGVDDTTKAILADIALQLQANNPIGGSRLNENIRSGTTLLTENVPAMAIAAAAGAVGAGRLAVNVIGSSTFAEQVAGQAYNAFRDLNYTPLQAGGLALAQTAIDVAPMAITLGAFRDLASAHAGEILATKIASYSGTVATQAAAMSVGNFMLERMAVDPNLPVGQLLEDLQDNLVVMGFFTGAAGIGHVMGKAAMTHLLGKNYINSAQAARGFGGEAPGFTQTPHEGSGAIWEGEFTRVPENQKLLPGGDDATQSGNAPNGTQGPKGPDTTLDPGPGERGIGPRGNDEPAIGGEPTPRDGGRAEIEPQGGIFPAPPDRALPNGQIEPSLSEGSEGAAKSIPVPPEPGLDEAALRGLTPTDPRQEPQLGKEGEPRLTVEVMADAIARIGHESFAREVEAQIARTEATLGRKLTVEEQAHEIESVAHNTLEGQYDKPTEPETPPVPRETGGKVGNGGKRVEKVTPPPPEETHPDEWKGKREQAHKDFVAGIEEQIAAGESNAELLPGENGPLPAGDTYAFRQALIEAGWENKQPSGKSPTFVKGDWELWLRSQGADTPAIAQWRKVNTETGTKQGGVKAEPFKRGDEIEVSQAELKRMSEAYSAHKIGEAKKGTVPSVKTVTFQGKLYTGVAGSYMGGTIKGVELVELLPEGTKVAKPKGGEHSYAGTKVKSGKKNYVMGEGRIVAVPGKSGAEISQKDEKKSPPKPAEYESPADLMYKSLLAQPDAANAKSYAGQFSHTLAKSYLKRMDREGVDNPIARQALEDRSLTDKEFIDARMTPAVRAEMQAMARNAGWAEVGGKMIRTPTGEAAGEETITRTQWIPNEPWWKGRAGNLSVEETRNAVSKALAGERLGDRQTLAVRYMIETAIENLALTKDFEAANLPKTEENFDNTQLTAWALEHYPDRFEEIATANPDNDTLFFDALQELFDDHNARQDHPGGEESSGQEESGQGRAPGDQAAEEVTPPADKSEFDLSASPGPPAGGTPPRKGKPPVSRLRAGQLDLLTEREPPESGPGEFETKAPKWHFSQLTRSIEAMTTASMPVEQWMGSIANMVKSGAAKRDELEVTGLEDWLSLQKGKVTRDQVLAYLKDAARDPIEHVHGSNSGEGDGPVQVEMDPGWIVQSPDEVMIEAEARDRYMNLARDELLAHNRQWGDLGATNFEPPENEILAEAKQMARDNHPKEEEWIEIQATHTDDAGAQVHDKYRAVYNHQEHRTYVMFKDPGTGWESIEDFGGRLDGPQVRRIVLDNINQIYDLADNAGGYDDDTAFASYTQPGGRNYRELVFELPGKEQGPLVYPDPLTELPEGYNPIHDHNATPSMKWGVTPPFQSHAKPWAGSHPTREAAIAAALNQLNEHRNEAAADEWRDRNVPRFQSSHFSYPDIVAHQMIKDDVDVDGRDGIRAEENQSDWAERARKIRSKEVERVALEKKITRKEANKLVAADFAWRKPERSTDGQLVDQIQALQQRSNQHRGSREEHLDLIAQIHALENERQAVTIPNINKLPRAPFVTKTDAWTSLLMKRLIVKAVREGKQWIAWPYGEAQVAKYRYALQKAVDGINWKKQADGSIKLQGYKNVSGGGGPVSHRLWSEAHDAIVRQDNLGFDSANEALSAVVAHAEDWDSRWPVDRAADANAINRYAQEKRRASGTVRNKVLDVELEPGELADAIGTAMASKITSSAETEGELSGREITVSDTGMAGYYDRIMPAVVNGILKKLGGGRVKDIEIMNPDPLRFFHEGRHIHFEELQRLYEEQIEESRQNMEVWPVSIRAQLGDVIAAMQDGVSFKEAMELHGSQALAEKIDPEAKMMHKTVPKAWHGFDITPEITKAVNDAGGLPLYTRSLYTKRVDLQIPITRTPITKDFEKRLAVPPGYSLMRKNFTFAPVAPGTPVGKEFVHAFNDLVTAGFPVQALSDVQSFLLMRKDDTGGMFVELPHGGSMIAISAPHLEHASKEEGDRWKRTIRGWLAHELTHALDHGGRENSPYQEMMHFASPNSPRLEYNYDQVYKDRTKHGDLFVEAWEAFYHHREGTQPLQEFLRYPFYEMMAGKWDSRKVQIELFAQMGHLYWTSRDLMREQLPKWYAAFDEIFQGHKDQSLGAVNARIRRALSGPIDQAKNLPGADERAAGPGHAPGARVGQVSEGLGDAGPGTGDDGLAVKAGDEMRPDAIRAYVREAFGVPVNEGLLGRSSKKIAGFWRPDYKTIWLHNRNNLDTLAHEIGHHLSGRGYRKIGAAEKGIRGIMRDHPAELLDPSGPFAHSAYANRTRAVRLEEGFAEFLRHYMTDRATAQRAAPVFFAAFETLLNATPKFKVPIEEFTKRVHENRNAAPEDRILAKTGEAKQTLGEVLAGKLDKTARDAIVYQTLDQWKPLNVSVEALQPGILPSQNPYISARLLAGDAAMIEDWLTRWTIPFATDKRLSKSNFGKPLMAIFDPVMKNEAMQKKFTAYLIARRAAELSLVGKENLFNRDEIRAGLSLQTPEFDAAAEELYNFNDQLLQYRIDAGILTQDLADKFREYEAYIPFFRMPDGFDANRPPTAHGITIHRLKGGKANLRDIIENLVTNTARTIRAANRNHVVQLLADMVRRTPGSGEIAEMVPIPKTVLEVQTQAIIDALEKQGVVVDTSLAQNLAVMQTFFQKKPITDARKQIFIFMEGGKPKALRINQPDLWDALNRMEPQEIGLLTSMFAFPARIARAAITLSPQFMESNFFRDTLAATMQAKSGFIPVLSSLKGIGKALEIRDGNKVLKAMSDQAAYYRALGGAYPDMWHQDTDEMKQIIQRVSRGHGIKAHLILTPHGIVRLLEKFGAAVEIGGRISEFEGVTKKMIAQGMSPVDAAIAATLAGREVSTDFAQHGANQELRTLARVTLFLNPALQGLRKAGRVLSGGEGKQTMFKAMMVGGSMMLTSLALYLANRDEEWYKEIEDWERNTYWHFKVGDEIYRVMKPFEYGLFFASIPEASMEYAIKRHGAEFRDRVLQGLGMVLGFRIMPHVPSVLMQWAYNYDDFAGHAIVPDSVNTVEPELQYGPRTSLTSRILAKGTGRVARKLEGEGFQGAADLVKTSPMKTDFLVRQLFQGLGQYVIMAADQTIRLAGDYPVEPATRWQEWPVISRFIHNTNNPQTRQMTQFYDELEKIRRAAASAKQYPDDQVQAYETLKGPLLDRQKEAEGSAKTQSKLRKEARAVYDDRTKTRQQKRDELNEIYKGMKQEARDYIEGR